ncbi:hypothetical protein QA641_29130 [Bradyrhizobium sp. CB1650]|uniref:hypothetical protein n=1 Tax=Bradyrhizobium sp. CB1650 TaxID=3039153 RepID=UPI002435F7D7|nr:hypothetical protein [Bradyrhizobium sp. CB1650]WGD49679.1 hypothetical protein QA641_29130 [Bradyrhizobium sp. CB1650]
MDHVRPSQPAARKRDTGCNHDLPIWVHRDQPRLEIRTMPDPPLNMSDDIVDLIVLESGVVAARDSPHELLGTVTLVTHKGHYDFLVDEEAATQLVQQLGELLRGDGPNPTKLK